MTTALQTLRNQIAALRGEIDALQDEPVGQTLREMRTMSADDAIETLNDSRLDGSRLESLARDRLEAHNAGTAFVVSRNAAAALADGGLTAGLRVPSGAAYRAAFNRTSDADLIAAIRQPTVGVPTGSNDLTPVVSAVAEGAAAAFGEDNPYTLGAFQALRNDPEALAALLQEALLQIRDEAREELETERQESIDAHCNRDQLGASELDTAAEAAAMATHAIGPISTELFALEGEMRALEERIARLDRAPDVQQEVEAIRSEFARLAERTRDLEGRWQDVQLSAAIVDNPAAEQVAEGLRLCNQLRLDVPTELGAAIERLGASLGSGAAANAPFQDGGQVFRDILNGN